MSSFPLNDYLLVAEGISHHYETPQGGVLALEGVGLALADHTFTCLVGASGSGKSTLLRILAGLVKPSAGGVFLKGEKLLKSRREIGIAFQDPNLMPWRTVEKNLVLPLELAGVSAREQKQRGRDMLTMLGLEEFAQAYPSALSGGMAQRLAIGRALIHDPDVLLLDEPFGALDALTREQVSSELLRIWSQNRKTVLMVTHSIQEAVLLSDRVLVMSPRPGRITLEIPISLPRPRHLHMVIEPPFVALEAEIRAALRII